MDTILYGEDGIAGGQGLFAFRETNRARHRSDDLLFEMASGHAPSGSDFLYSLVEHLARSVDAHCAWIAETAIAPVPTLRTLAVSIAGRDAENFEYLTAGTPAQELFSNSGICLFSANVRDLFPADAILRVCGASGYAGIPLVDSTGELLGLIAVASREPFANTRLVASQLRICASRAAVELERLSAEAARQATEARLKLIFDRAPDAYLLLTLDGKLLEANLAAERLTGFTRAEMVGRNVLMPGLMPEEEIRRAASRLQVRAAGAPASQEEFTLLHRDGTKVFTETFSEIAMIDGDIVMLLCIRDITARKTAQQERQAAIDRIQQLQDVALTLATNDAISGGEVKRFAGHVTRTLCDLTRAVAAAVWLFPGEENDMRCLDRFEAANGTHFGEEIVLPETYNRAELRDSPVIVHPATHVLDAGIHIDKRIAGILRIEPAPGGVAAWQPEELGLVATVSHLLGQSLSNAGRAQAEHALRETEAGLERIHREDIRKARRLESVGRITNELAQEFANLLRTVQSHGILILRKTAPENVLRDQLTTILDNCKAASALLERLLALSRLGTTAAPMRDIDSAVLDFNMAPQPPIGRAVETNTCDENPLADQTIRGNETILLVEDQPGIRTLARTTLEGLGYHVLSASDGEAALRLSLEYRAPIHLLLTDIVMPGIPGGELASRLIPLRPALKVLFMSGYTTQSELQKNIPGSGRGFIPKPFDPVVLAAKVRNLLDPGKQPS